jgi:hypothetical protein
MDPAGRNKILSRRRGRKPEEKRFKNTLEEENGAKKTANSNRQDQDISITPLGDDNRPPRIRSVRHSHAISPSRCPHCVTINS